MRKKSYVARLGALAAALTLVTTCLMGGTLAQYVTEVSGSATATVAKWSFKSNTDSKTPIDLGSTTNRGKYGATEIKEGVIAPGTSGAFDIEVDGTGSDVGIAYTVKMDTASGTTLPAGFTMKVDGVAYTSGTEKTGTIAYSSTSGAMKKTIPVTWEWTLTDASGTTKDTTDTALGEKTDAVLIFDITITGKQVEPTSTTP